jgi:hypothetical protein
MADELAARNLAKWGLRRGAYDGARSRRFCWFEKAGITEWRREYTSKRERDGALRQRLAELRDRAAVYHGDVDGDCSLA